MNIQIFGKKKCFDTKKAERYFKERRIKYQMVDLARFGMSKGELSSVKAAVGGLEPLVDEKAEGALLLRYLASEDAKIEKLLSPLRFSVRRSSGTGSRRPWAIARRFGKHGSETDGIFVCGISKMHHLPKGKKVVGGKRHTVYGPPHRGTEPHGGGTEGMAHAQRPGAETVL